MAYRDFEIRERKAKKRKFVPFKDLIIYEDEQIIVVNKPAGVASLDDREEVEQNLLAWGRNYFPDVQLCHRLDKNTTGAQVFAKNPEAYRDISMQFEHRQVAKHYVAVVNGVRRFEEFEVDEPIYQTGSGTNKVNHGRGKPATTIVNTVEDFRDHSVVDCFPLTGRTHQVRVHLSYIGCPIIGDGKYGGKDLMLSKIKKNYSVPRDREEAPVNKGFLLHARGLNLTIPGQEEATNFIAPLPKNFEVVLKILRKYGGPRT